MKPRYEVSYYEYGLTKEVKRRFFLDLSAYLYAAYIYYMYKESRPNLRIYER